MHVPAVTSNKSAAKAVIFAGMFALLWIGSVCPGWKALILVFVLYVLTGGWRFLRVCLLTTRRDLTSLIRLIRIKTLLYLWKRRNLTVPQVFQKQVQRHPHKACFLYEDETWTFKEMEEFSNRIGNGFAELGLLPGEDVALFMESRPEYVGIWLGLAKIGVVPALINTNQRLQILVHSILAVDCKVLIFSSKMLPAVKEVLPLLKVKSSLKYFCLGNFDPTTIPQCASLDTLVQEAAIEPPSNGHKGTTTDRLYYVYTSGTTGMPKAAIIKHNRMMWMAAALQYLVGIHRKDLFYNCLPLYHTAGGTVGVGQAVLFGNTVVIRQKFSASKFWEDCIRYKCTVANYIGEICRYLLAQPERPEEKQHQVRMMYGNGLRPQIWTQFTTRFNIKQIGEFYGSTEGNANVINVDNKVGSIGFISRILPAVYPVTLIKVDSVTGEPLRNSNGLCIHCGPGEPGELVGKILAHDPARSFDGYLNKNATQKKIARDVFRKGDMAFLTGDILIMDELGYLFFKDRTGDTFRWRGENVSTSEVEAVISQIIGLSDCVVYGVEVPGSEGKAGMASILDPNYSVNLNNLYAEAKRLLPSYAIPLFIRLVEKLDTTSTYKFKKIDLQTEGYDLGVVKDPVYFLNAKLGTYVRLDKDTYNNLANGTMCL